MPKKLPHQILSLNLNLGFDPMVFTSRNLLYYFRNKVKLTPITNTIINSNISNNHTSKFYSLDPKVVGETVDSKIKRLIQILKKDRSDHIFISAPENVAWLLNIRGKDLPNSPLGNCKLIISKKGKLYFFKASL